MRRVLFGLIIAIFVFSAAACAYAKDMKAAYVDMRKVFFEYKKTKEFDKKLEDKDKSKKAERDAKVEEVRKLRDEIDVLSEKAKPAKQTVLDSKLKDLDTFDRQYRDEITRQKDDMFREVLQDIGKVIENYSKANGYDIVYDSRTLLYASPDYDITDKILTDLNK